tara:strand:- start:66 stop:791 length:726 start_codon:yes stop_codon:yes gene_type:complete
MPHLIDWLREEAPDIVGLQETKVEDSAFPISDLESINYSALFLGQKTYNGVAFLFKKNDNPELIKTPSFFDNQKRIIAIRSQGIVFVNLYVPNGSRVDSEKYEYKLQWLTSLIDWVKDTFKKNSKLILMGDFNIAPSDIDVHDPELWKDKILCSVAERQAFKEIIDLGLYDAYRLAHNEDKSFTWWDYRLNGFRRNLGLRIDHILVSESLRGRVSNVEIAKNLRSLERPSDHAPVVASISN